MHVMGLWYDSKLSISEKKKVMQTGKRMLIHSVKELHYETEEKLDVTESDMG